ncbi:MAG: ROK family transcriptional regulator [Spirochaetaceae bacterium]|nr:MAG: ROK family transcriptional regulator [Spirochaetaceae bacterium]
MAVNRPALRRSDNLGLVMRALGSGKASTRSELANLLGLDRSTMTHLVGKLLETGLVEQSESADAAPAESTHRPAPRAGRRPLRLLLRHDRLLVGGIELTATAYRAVVMDNAGSLLLRDSGPNPHPHDPARAIAAVSDRLSSLARGAGVRPFAVGVGLSGIVDPHRARLVSSDAFDAHDVDLARHLPANGTGAPALVFDNDANCGAWGELHAGGHADRDFIFVLGRDSNAFVGVGLGLALDGAIYYGRRYQAGEFAGVERVRAADSQFSLTQHQLLRARVNRAIMRRVVTELLQALVPLMAALDPSRVVLGGMLRTQVAAVRRLLQTDLACSPAAGACLAIPFAASHWDEDEVAAGAAGMVLEKLFSGPRPERRGGRDTVTWEQLFDTITR